MLNRFPMVCILLIAIAIGSCSTVQQASAPDIVTPPEKICLVLSVGGQKGLAHLGAIRALKEKGIRIDAVYGNSMGAIIGALYASAPDDNVSSRYRECIDLYVQKTKSEKTSGALVGALVGAFFSGGASLLGALIGVGSVEQLDISRIQETLDEYFVRKDIHDFSIPFATSYFEVINSSPVLRVVSSGNSAEAICRSANNPLIFKTTNLQYVDPGADRLAATPIQEAYNQFKPTRIIAINVSGSPAIIPAQFPCSITEVVISLNDVDPRALMGSGASFDNVVNAGYTATMNALANSPNSR